MGLVSGFVFYLLYQCIGIDFKKRMIEVAATSGIFFLLRFTTTFYGCCFMMAGRISFAQCHFNMSILPAYHFGKRNTGVTCQNSNCQNKGKGMAQ